MFVAKENLYLSRPDETGAVRILKEEDNPGDRQFLLAAEGAVIPDDVALKHGLIEQSALTAPNAVSSTDLLTNPVAVENTRLSTRIAELEAENEKLRADIASNQVPSPFEVPNEDDLEPEEVKQPESGS